MPCTRDVGGGDLTAALVRESLCSVAHVLSREPAVLCGRRWFDHIFQTRDPSVRIEWRAQDGDEIEAGHALCPLSGSARALRPIQGWMLHRLPELGFGVSW